jgi:hypothetical protein
MVREAEEYAAAEAASHIVGFKLFGLFVLCCLGV